MFLPGPELWEINQPSTSRDASFKCLSAFDDEVRKDDSSSVAIQDTEMYIHKS